MKKTLSFLVALCIAGLFSAKAQSASDSSLVRDLSYTTFSSMPSLIIDSLANGKILKNLRFGRRAKGYTFTLSTTKTVKIRMNGVQHFDTYLYLLDSTFTTKKSNDDDNGGSTIIDTLTPGRYYIVAAEYDYHTEIYPFSIALYEYPPATIPLNSLTYTPLGTFSDTIVYDTISMLSAPYIAYQGDTVLARGYSFQGTQDKIITIFDSNYNAYYVLMDSNLNILGISNYLCKQLPQTGTYYLVAASFNEYYTTITHISFGDLTTYYVNNLNGNDTNSGLTPATAVATLDAALYKAKGVGKFYLTEDYTFSDYYVQVLYAMIYPYGKDIRLFLPTSGNYDDVFENYGTLILGEQDSNHYFIIDSSHGTIDNFIEDGWGSITEINNLKILNSKIENYDYMFEGDNLIMRNCEFINDTFYYGLIDVYPAFVNTLKLSGCNISNNHFSDGFMSTQDSVKFTMENTTVSGNGFNYNSWPPYFYGGATVNLTSGTWSRNYVYPYFSDQDNTFISGRNAGGIWIEGSTVNIGAGFTMDTNNYLCLDTATTVNITENLTAPVVATLYPMFYDEYDYIYRSDYRTGRPMLSGSATLLANNFRKFKVAQADTVAWYLHSDGKIYTDEEPVGLASATEGTIRLYPNPANNVLNIALQGTEVNEVVVIDIYGKTAMRNTVADGNNSFDISSLPAGMYFVQLRADNAVKATQKLIKR